MGQRPGDGAVVDATGRVHATGRLTVADASIVPNATSAVTHIPTVTLAERLAEQIASATSRLGRAYLGNLRVLALSAVLPGQPRIVGRPPCSGAAVTQRCRIGYADTRVQRGGALRTGGVGPPALCRASVRAMAGVAVISHSAWPVLPAGAS